MSGIVVLLSIHFLSLCSYRICSDCFLCFFKQKTAYEMRISDWSSDVCSSDLVALEARLRRTCVAPRQRRHEEEFGDGLTYRDTVDAIVPQSDQIGRASCRERVCQYV